MYRYVIKEIVIVLLRVKIAKHKYGCCYDISQNAVVVTRCFLFYFSFGNFQ